MGSEIMNPSGAENYVNTMADESDRIIFSSW